MRNDIPYYRVFLHIPRDMKDKLPQEYIALLETTV
jgi:RNA polymerase I-specific transcription initiation factor RRN7